MPSHADDDAPLQDRVQAGDHHALGELFGRHRGRLLKMVRLRLDRRLRGRLDPEDVVQEAFLDAAPGWEITPPIPGCRHSSGCDS